eukprot:TRINITY_DN6568_c0_g1_i2.p1 TRINITY_DN6568_c0_g1~~TRINITY_DN6568_c0_g1_i2.p1  ORF type:complete len:100 (-),score=24.05 TRINITY_DN6568_c0_g1_i2:28-327(-)
MRCILEARTVYPQKVLLGSSRCMFCCARDAAVVAVVAVVVVVFVVVVAVVVVVVAVVAAVVAVVDDDVESSAPRESLPRFTVAKSNGLTAKTAVECLLQ